MLFAINLPQPIVNRDSGLLFSLNKYLSTLPNNDNEVEQCSASDIDNHESSSEVMPVSQRDIIQSNLENERPEPTTADLSAPTHSTCTKSMHDNEKIEPLINLNSISKSKKKQLSTSRSSRSHSEYTDIPDRYIIGCDNDMKEARRRWDLTKKWRKANQADEILSQPQPNFFTIKTLYPNYHCTYYAFHLCLRVISWN